MIIHLRSSAFSHPAMFVTECEELYGGNTFNSLVTEEVLSLPMELVLFTRPRGEHAGMRD